MIANIQANIQPYQTRTTLFAIPLATTLVARLKTALSRRKNGRALLVLCAFCIHNILKTCSRLFSSSAQHARGCPHTARGRTLENIGAPSKQATSSKQQVARNKQQAASNKQQATSSKKKAASSKQQAASSKQLGSPRTFSLPTTSPNT